MPADALVILSSAGLLALAMLAAAATWAWSGWLKLRARELDARIPGFHDQSLPAVGQRIDLADLKERIRKLEAIAAGVEW